MRLLKQGSDFLQRLAFCISKGKVLVLRRTIFGFRKGAVLTKTVFVEFQKGEVLRSKRGQFVQRRLLGLSKEFQKGRCSSKVGV
jgi:hypothetical protein